MSKRQYEKLTTPIGVALYPYLSSPDTKFKEEGEYKVDLLLDLVEDADFIGNLKARSQKAFEEEKVKLIEKNKHANAKKLKEVYFPMEKVYDDEGNETGQVKVKFKTKATRTKKDGTTYEVAPDIFDSQGKLLNPKEVNIGSQSRIRVNFTPAGFYSPAINKAGITLYLNAVQLIELVEYGSGAQANDYGFGQVEDGFSIEETDFGTDTGTEEATADSSGDFDFEGADF